MIRVDDDGDIPLLAEAFDEPFFMSDLAEGKSEAWRELAQVKHVLSREDAKMLRTSNTDCGCPG